MMGRIQIIAMLAGGGVFFGMGWVAGSSSEAKASEKREDAVRKTGESLLQVCLNEQTTLKAERDQAQAEVAKVNASTAAQYELIVDLLQSDAAARDVALAKVERAARQASAEARTAGEKAAAAREVIQNVADQCARAGVPADVVRMLDDILATPAP